MPRAPFNVHVLPYRKTDSGIEYVILKRADAGYWQGIAGGGEDNETPLATAKRESKEKGQEGEWKTILNEKKEKRSSCRYK